MIEVQLTIDKAQVYQEVAKTAEYVATKMGDNLAYERISIVDENEEMLERILNTAYAVCVEMLYPYTKEEIPKGQVDLDDILHAPEEYVINLCLPDSFSLSTVNLLNKLIHEYLIYSVLSHWMSIANPSSVENWEVKRQAVKRKIQTCLMSRRVPIRRKLKPF